MIRNVKNFVHFYTPEITLISFYSIIVFVLMAWACYTYPAYEARQMCQDHKTINNDFDCTQIYKDAGLIK